MHGDRERISDKFRHKRRRLRLLGGPRAKQHQQAHTFESTGEIEEPTKRGLVSPVQVVYKDERWFTRSEIRGQPVEPVQHRERQLGCPSFRRGSRRRSKYKRA